MKLRVIISTFVLVVAVGGCCTASKPEAMGNANQKLDMASFYLPNAEGSRVVSVTTNGPVAATILVQTHAVAVKETGPKETVAKFGEVYAFSPTFFAVHREEPTQIRFWNLQPDDNHDVMLIDPHAQVLMKLLLPPLKETTYVFTFHEEGLFNLICAMHLPSMNAQILVLPPKSP